MIYGSIYHPGTKQRTDKIFASGNTFCSVYIRSSVKGGTQTELGDAQVIEGLGEARETKLWSLFPQAGLNHLGRSLYLHLGDLTTVEKFHISELDEFAVLSYMADSAACL